MDVQSNYRDEYCEKSSTYATQRRLYCEVSGENWMIRVNRNNSHIGGVKTVKSGRRERFRNNVR